MPCKNHPFVEDRLTRCARCAEAFCPDCIVEIGGLPYCLECKTESMRDLLAASVAQPRLRTWLITGFAAVALLLTLIGLYGILAFTVSRRTKEIGIRLALGASDRQVVGMILRQGVPLVKSVMRSALAGLG